MKEGWKMVKLGEVCEIINGKNQKEVISPEGQFPILGSGGNVMGYATEYLCPAGTIIIGRKGSINNPLFIDTPFWNVDTAFGFNARDNYERKLLYYFCLLFDFEKLNKGTTLPSLVKSDLLQIEIPLPPLEEQHRIVSILDVSFEKIDALKKNAEENLKNAKALFQQVLAQELKPKEGWVEKKLTDISENLDYKRVPITKNVRKSGKFPYYGASGIVDYVNDYLYDEDLLLISEDGANLLARTTPIAFSVSGKIWVNNHAHVLRFNNLTLQKFVEYFIAGFNITPYVTGMAQPKLNQKALEKIIISFPTNIEEQHRIVRTLDTLSEKCRRLEQIAQQTIRECDALKQSILRQAFSGKL